MAKHPQLPKPPSLAQLFEPPDGFLGSFGWLCGYTADAGFLNDAAERFVRETRAQRSHTGKIAIAMMLDPSNPQISPVDVPGVAHLPMQTSEHRPFRLLHAKVALLGYRAIEDAANWKVRLIVSTGNWTRSTLEESLDLTWHIELSRQDLRVEDEAVRQARADINAAWNLMRWLRGVFDTRLLSCKPAHRDDTYTSDAFAKFDLLMSEVRSTRGVVPRFLDSRHGSLLSQLPANIPAQAGAVRRNYIGMGSGFYEKDTTGGQVPSVLSRIVKTLREHRLLTQNPEVDVFVNPRGCQAVPKSLPALKSRGWTVREAHKPEYFGAGSVRSLHAKFVFSANLRQDSDYCNSAWIYLGSGNLTAPGFANKMSRNGGNLEAGVLFEPETLYWKQGKGVHPEQVVSNLLPVDWHEDSIIKTPDAVAAGDEFTAGEPAYFASPVSCLFWETDGDSSYLKPLDGDATAVDVLDNAGQACPRHDTHGFLWSEARPRQVKVCWRTDSGNELEALVPVLDELGRVAATNLPAIEIDEVWWQLENFPMPPDADDVLSEEGSDGVYTDICSADAKAHRPATYPIRKMMHLVENIAAKQTGIAMADWKAWCTRLEQSMIQAAESSVITACKQLTFNPLSPLREAPFRPVFAESGDTPEGSRYEDALRRIESKWEVANLKSFGGWA